MRKDLARAGANGIGRKDKTMDTLNTLQSALVFFLCIVPVSVMIRVYAAFGIRTSARNDAIQAGFSVDEVDEETGAGHGVINFIRKG